MSSLFHALFFFFLTVRHLGSLGLRSGIEPISPALEGEVLTAGLLGQSLKTFSSLLNKTFWAWSVSSHSQQSGRNTRTTMITCPPSCYLHHQHHHRHCSPWPHHPLAVISPITSTPSPTTPLAPTLNHAMSPPRPLPLSVDRISLSFKWHKSSLWLPKGDVTWRWWLSHVWLFVPHGL